MEVEKAKEKRQALINELEELKNKAVGFSMTGNRKYYARGTISQELWDAYKRNSKKILAAEKDITWLNKIISAENKDRQDQFCILRDIIKESAPDDWENIIAEFKSRDKGNPPTKVTLLRNDNTLIFGRIKTLKKIILELTDDLITVRANINSYIGENEPEINKGEFLKKVSILNKSCRPISELVSIKNKISVL